MTATLQLFLSQAWQVTADLSPWLLLGLVIAGLLHVLLPQDLVRRHLGRPGFAGVFKAAAFGVPLPLCSCGVIPATIGLKKDGASDGACTAFLVSTPQTGVDSIMVSAVFLGWPFALYKVVSALLTGLLAGWLVDLTAPHGPAGNSADRPADKPQAATGRRWRSIPEALREFWDFAVLELFGSIWRWVLLGILVSAAISTFIPVNTFDQIAWMRGPAGMLVMLVIALPMYVCATGSVPIAASLVAAGLPAGSALVFLMAGPASNAATIGAVWKTFGRRVTLIYLGVIAAGSLVLGWGFQSVLSGKGGTASAACHHMAAGESMSPAAHLWALLLAGALAAFVAAALRGWWRRRTVAGPATACGCTGGQAGSTAAGTAGGILLLVDGMHCENCAGKVRAALLAVPSVDGVEVDRKAGRVRVTGAALDPEQLRSAVRAAGYAVR